MNTLLTRLSDQLEKEAGAKLLLGPGKIQTSSSVNPILMQSFHDELEKIGFLAGVGRAASHLGGAVGRGLKTLSKKPILKDVAGEGLDRLGTSAMENKKLTGKITAGVVGTGLVGTGAVLS